MSLGGTLSDQQTFNGSTSVMRISKADQNLFQKIELVSSELQKVSSKMIQLSQQTQSIRTQKDLVEGYLQRKSQQNRQRLMGELQLFQNEINKKIQDARNETQKVDERIAGIKEGQLFTLQMILALQRRVRQLEVQLGMREEEYE